MSTEIRAKQSIDKFLDVALRDEANGILVCQNEICEQIYRLAICMRFWAEFYLYISNDQ